MHPTSWLTRFLKSLGPGFITGAADDDPSGIGAYSQTGAAFGFTQLWLVPFSLPFMIAIQEMCGRIGLVTGKGLAAVIKRSFARPVLYGAIALLFVANVINISADLGAMAASVQLVLPSSFSVLLLVITAVIILLQVLVPYRTYAKFLKYLTLSLVAYIFVALLVNEDWSAIARATLIPYFSWDKDYILNVAAMFGTTISPYLFFWQADEEVEEEIIRHEIRAEGAGRPKIAEEEVHQMRIDTGIGMFFSQLITFFIIVTVASTLHAHGITSVDSASAAAEALRPFAGDYAFALFTLGIIGTGFIAVPVLAGSVGYAVGEAFGWRVGLGRKLKHTEAFYGVITVSTIIGLLISLMPINPISMLYYAAIVNGVLAPPLMILILIIGNDKRQLGGRTNGPLSNILGIIITIIMSAASLATIYSVL